MIADLNPVLQALLGTLLTWGLTALGSGVVFILPQAKRSILDASLGFAAGVMTAASFWSLLAPAIEIASDSGTYGETGTWAFVPVSIGFLFGSLFVYAADQAMSRFGIFSQDPIDSYKNLKKEDELVYQANYNSGRGNILLAQNRTSHSMEKPFISLDLNDVKQRRINSPTTDEDVAKPELSQINAKNSHIQWKRIILMIVAITVHNVPEGLAVGIGFGAIGKTRSATFAKAKNLAIGIGIQNFPEGMAVSLPLRGAGYSLFSAFFWGQLSGMVEPIAGVLGALAVNMCTPILPYALAFAAGAMIFVVVDDIIPEAHSCGNGQLSSFWCIGGFITMMILDVGLG